MLITVDLLKSSFNIYSFQTLGQRKSIVPKYLST